MLFKLIFLSVFSLIVAEKVRYDDFSLFKVNPENDEQLNFLNQLQKDDGIDFWTPPTRVGDHASLVSSPQKKNELLHTLNKRNINYEVILHDIQQAFDDQILGRKKRDTRDLLWTGYQTRDDIYEWFEELANTHSFVSLIHVGRSFEGRNITGIRINRGSSKAIFIQGGQVGADWLSPTVVTYLIDQLVRGVDPEAGNATIDYDWHIFPILNPDGFEYSQDVDRLWIKNRQPTKFSIGVDISRNWNSHWGVIGGSFVHSDRLYLGLGPFSEIESRVVSNYIEDIASQSQLKVVLSLSSYGQRLLLPFAHSTAPMYNYNETIVVGRRAMGSLAVKHNTQYIVGTSRAVHDGSTGSISDWAKHRFAVPLAATLLLRDTGTFGYTLPVNQVLPTCEETFDGIMAILREAKFINLI